MKTSIAYFIVLLAAVLWGTTGTAQTFLPQSTHPLSIGALRMAIGGFTLLLYLLMTKKLDITSIPWKPALIAGICMALFQPLFFTSVRVTGIAVGTVVAIGSAPIFTGILERIFWKRKPNRKWVIATIMAILGCILLFSNKESVTVNPFGIGMSLVAGFAFALYTIVSKDVLAKLAPVSSVAVTFSISALFLSPFFLLFPIGWVVDGANFTTILYLGWMTTTLAYILFLTGLKHIPSSAAVTLSLGEPLTAALLSVFVVNETLSMVSWLGVGLLLGGIIVLTIQRKKPVREEGFSIS
ncbi:DMT family transporter [Paenisporosarcina cavernae]|uniref:EamA family transporter n=1 Tax=Paenisporosarcina cavernae TaxID=2320858 RepID=A0A385YPJ5_9BACL|nr:EamA family transporter [Paenisporosarcina cavernae]AYC28649.1 EamA family transporter [Paenisporosarcina cavernae]